MCLKSVAVSCLLAGVLAGCGAEDAPVTSSVGRNVRSHIEILAADDMQGREAGTPGHQRAAQYVASQFAAIGLQPIGDDGTWFQNVEFVETRLVKGSAAMQLHRGGVDTTLEYGKDFLRTGGFGEADEAVTAPLVFVGFGIQAPAYDHDDFAGVDVSGKILVEFTGAPPGFSSDERAFYSSGAGKQALAVRLGAVGIILIRTPVDQKLMTWPRMLGATKSSSMRWIGPRNNIQDGFSELTGNAFLSESGAEQLFDLAGRGLDRLFERHTEGHTGSFDLGVTATLNRQSSQHRTTSPNVLALLPGGDPELSHEFVLFTAHLDHIGIRGTDNGDEIHNGAYDNAAGVAVVLELARALARSPQPPRRSIVFAAVTAEEKGLRGSDYLAHNPPVPIADIVANINIDMPYLGHPLADVEGFGVEHSTLHGALTRAAEQLELSLTPDPRPELVRLIRSDQFSFVKQGVPGLNLKPGSKSTDPAIDGTALRSAFLKDHYHGPSDDLNLPYSEEGAERFVNVAIALGLIVANDEEPPRWKDGDFFGDLYANPD